MDDDVGARVVVRPAQEVSREHAQAFSGVKKNQLAGEHALLVFVSVVSKILLKVHLPQVTPGHFFHLMLPPSTLSIAYESLS